MGCDYPFKECIDIEFDALKRTFLLEWSDRVSDLVIHKQVQVFALKNAITSESIFS